MMFVALMLCPFAFIMGAFVFSGVLAPMAVDFGVSVGAVAALQSALAISCALSGPFLARMTQKLPKRAVLLAVLFALIALNTASALTAHYPSLLVLRILVGIIGALAFPVATALAVSSVDDGDRAGVIAKVYSGIPLAMIAGIPLGSLVGNAYGWPACFLATAAVCAIAFVFVALWVPNEQPDNPIPSAGTRGVNKAVVPYLVITLLASAGFFTLVGLLGPVIRSLTGFGGPGIAALQVLAGVASLAGIKLGARLAAYNWRYTLAGLSAVLAISLAALVPAFGFQVAGTPALSLVLISLILGPVTQFAINTNIQARLAGLAGGSATLVFALNASMIYLGQGLGIGLGSLTLNAIGIAGIPLSGTFVAVIGFMIAAWLGQTAVRNKLQTARG